MKRDSMVNVKVAQAQRLSGWRELILVYVVILYIWGLYRLLFRLPVWVEEILLKGLVFGGPVYYVYKRYQWRLIDMGVTGINLAPSVYLGVFLGIMMGLVGNVGNIIRHGALLLSDQGVTTAGLGGFIILSLLTAFWEQLLFCGVFLRLAMELIVDEWNSAWLISGLFVLLHVPQLLFVQKLPWEQFMISSILLFLLQMGAVILMFRGRNLLAPVMAQALWGITVYLFR
jgi:hypothetical protein